MERIKETCQRCRGTGVVKIRIDSLLFDDHRFCTRCVEGNKRWSRLREIIRRSEPGPDRSIEPPNESSREQVIFRESTLAISA